MILHPVTARRLKLRAHSQIWLHFGKKSHRVKIRFSKRLKGHEIVISQIVAHALKLPAAIWLQTSAGKGRVNCFSRTIKKTPVIGILIDKVHKRQNHEFIKEIFNQARLFDIRLFMFGPGQVKGPASVYGYTQDRSRRWKYRNFKRVDIVLDRHPSYSRALHRLRRMFRHKLANHKTGGKWSIYQALRAEKDLAEHLPQTMTFHSNRILPMLKKHGLVYIKPKLGSMGHRIVAIEKQLIGYSLTSCERGKPKRQQIISEQILVAKVKRLTTGRPFLIQQGLRLKFADRVTDMRLVLQKNGQGEWVLAGEGMRVGPKNSPISNLAAGASVEGSERVLERLFDNEKSKSLLEECHSLGLQVAKRMEKYYGRMSELGLDLGIDQSGKIWIIEVNSMPGRKTILATANRQAYCLSHRMPLEYALHLIKSRSV